MKINQFKKQLKAFVKEDADPVVHADSAGQYAVSFINFRYITVTVTVTGSENVNNMFVFDSVEIVDDKVFLYYGRDRNWLNIELMDKIEFHTRRPFDVRED